MRITNFLAFLLSLFVMGMTAQTSAQSEQAASTTPSAEKPVFNLRMGKQEEHYPDHYEVGKRIRFHLVAELPESLANTDLRGLFWPIDDAGQLLARPNGLVGIAPIGLVTPNYTHGPKTFYLPNGRRQGTRAIFPYGQKTQETAFTAFVIVYKFFDDYDYSIVGNSKLDLIAQISDLSRYAIFDDIRLTENGIAYTLMSERNEPVRWRAVSHWYMGMYQWGYSMPAAYKSIEFDFKERCHFRKYGFYSSDICNAVEFRPQLSPDDAFAEFARFSNERDDLASAQEERRRALQAENLRQKESDIRALVGDFNTVALNGGECAETAAYQIYSGPVDAMLAWRKALAIDRQMACRSVPTPFYDAFKNARAQRLANAKPREPQRDYWKEINDAISNAPSVLKCTRDYTKGVETCQWVKP